MFNFSFAFSSILVTFESFNIFIFISSKTISSFLSSFFNVFISYLSLSSLITSFSNYSKILDEDYDDIYKKVNKKKMALVKVKRWIDDKTANKVTKAGLSGIWVAEDNQRYYPYGNFASYVLGHTSSDSSGVAGIELKYDGVLKGTAGKLVVSTDAAGKEIPQGSEQYYEPTTGNGLVLTIDEVIQHYCEKASI